MSIPVPFSTLPLKRLVSSIASGVSVNATDVPAEKGSLGVLKTSCVYTGVFDSSENKTVVAEDVDRVACPVRADTLVVSRMNTPDLVGAAGLATLDQPDIYLPDRLWQVSFDQTIANPRYVYWWTRSTLYRDQVKVACAGTSSSMQNLDQDSFRSFVVPSLSVSEQIRIAKFLDDKTARIDALISEKEQLQKRLEEFRLSVISQAVSVGLSSKTQRIPTGDEWFDAVPSHWAYCPLNYRYEVQLGKMLDEKRITGEHLRPYLRNTDVQWGQINMDALPVMDIHPSELLRYTVRPGDLLVCEGGDVGRAAIWSGSHEEIAYQKALHRVRPRSTSDLPRFLFYALFDSAKRGRFNGREKATIAHLTAEAFRRYRFPFPPVNEQHAIVEYLDAQMNRLSELQLHCGEHISRLREYRSSLISASVTGQRDLGTDPVPRTEPVVRALSI